MPRRSPSPPPANDCPADRLQIAVDLLADNIRVVTEIIEQIREDLSWLTRNGIPRQPLMVHVQRMPRLSDGGTTDGSFEFSISSLPLRDPTAETLPDSQLRAHLIDQVVDRLADPIGQIAQEQLNLLLSVLDHAHRDILQAIRNPGSVPGLAPRKTRPRKGGCGRSAKPPVELPQTTPVSEPPPPPGQLF